MIRDYALATSGLLVKKIGGPSVRPYQPDGVWEAVAISGSNTRFYKQDSGESLYRRSLYTFWKRSAPPASLDIFNAPSRESCTVRRERTDTPLAGACHAQRYSIRRSGAERWRKTPCAKAAQPIQRRSSISSPTACWPARLPSAAKKPIVAASLRDLTRRLRRATQIGTTQRNSSPSANRNPTRPYDPQKLAAWTMLVNQLMNLRRSAE